MYFSQGDFRHKPYLNFSFNTTIVKSKISKNLRFPLGFSALAYQSKSQRYKEGEV